MFPKLKASRLAELRDMLRPTHQLYTTTVSTPGMAMSLETGAVLFHIAELTDAKRLVDFGSGLSSYVFRHYAEFRPDVTVISVDDSADWLTRTGTFLQQCGLDRGELVEWSSFDPTGIDADLVFHDLAMGALREEAMPIAAASLAQTGIIVFDDMQHEGHRAAAEQVCAAAGLKMRDLKQTYDGIGRWARAASR